MFKTAGHQPGVLARSIRSAGFPLWIGAMFAACGSQSPIKVDKLSEDVAHHKLENGIVRQLGRGVNFSETKIFNRCIDVSGTEEISYGFEQRHYRETRVRDHRDLNEQLNISTEAAAKALFIQGKLSAGYFSHVAMTDDAVYLLVDANYVLADEMIDTRPTHGFFRLTKLAQDVLLHEGLDAFHAVCGTHFYYGLTRGARYSLLYEFKSREDQVVKNLKASMDASGIGWEGQGQLKKLFQFAETSSHMTVASSIKGGDESIKNYVQDSAQLQDQLERLAGQLYHEKMGPVIDWMVSDYEIIPEVQKQIANSKYSKMLNYRSDALRWYYTIYNRNQSEIAKASSEIERSQDDNPWVVYAPEDLEAWRNMIQELQVQNDFIRERAQKCIVENKECETQDIAPIVYHKPKPQMELSGLHSWSIKPVALSMSDRYIDLLGSPPGTNQLRIFDTRHHLLEDERGALVKFSQKDGPEQELIIGRFHVVDDEKTGVPRVNICTGTYAKRCELRVIEDFHKQKVEGYPYAKLQLIIFSDEGYILKKFDFYPIPLA